MTDSIILFGVPRCGSSWLSSVLTYGNDIRKVHEPDNEMISFLGLLCKQGYGRFPYLHKEDVAPLPEKLFDVALNHTFYSNTDLQSIMMYRITSMSRNTMQRNLNDHGTALVHRPFYSEAVKRLLIRAPHHNRVLIKTVHGLLMYPFLADKFRFIPVFLQRHPLNIFSSYIKMALPDMNRKLYADSKLLDDLAIEKEAVAEKSQNYQAGFQLGLFNKAIRKFLQMDTAISPVLVQYETLISDPEKNMEQLCGNLSIKYTTEMENYMKSQFRQGSGYETRRNIEGYGKIWQSRLEKSQVDQFVTGYQHAFGEIDFEY